MQLWLKAGTGWREVGGFEKADVQDGDFEATDGTTERGKMITLFLRFDRFDIGQAALRKLADMEPRVINFRTQEPAGTVEGSMIIQSSGTNEKHSDLFVIAARLVRLVPIRTVIN